MQELENNALFWQKVDTLILSSTIEFSYPKGSAHPQYPAMIYPVDYGYLTDTTSADSDPIHLYRGSINSARVNAIVVSCDILKKDCVAKLLVGCTEEEMSLIMRFMNQTEFQKTILVRRGTGVPAWASED